ncbi:hypothetical protein K432DRAFT_430130 [Lepidopterella palustris CBS 459.81]|uniref:Mediator of RNA polymerase II transcription subunit 16 n=1 Tax=Lepidopterella palustris CBS 459.81 TaxID=1314670 RepID=A0A8E2DZ19_9PEZI|nr:hypothetical protein K432DRAFT_430130 [Lepidopterella palustris CBS 459.81]
MDDDTYMEDLFGDSEPVHLPTMAVPIKGLAQRLDELQESGCCQKIAWSKSGCVASITPDGRGVNFRAFFRNASDGKWVLGNEMPLKNLPAHDEFPYVHISWAHIGTDLAVLDSAGRIYIFTNAFVLGRMNLTKTHVVDQEDEMAAVVGMHWLSIIPHQQKNHIVWSASRGGDDWSFEITSHTFNDAHHPMESKLALICVGKNGLLRLRFQQPDNSWQEAMTELEHMSSAREPFTHAAFASNNDNSLLLVAHDVVGHLHLYRIRIHWTMPPPLKQGQQPKPIIPPSLEVISLMVEDHCYPESSASIDGDLTLGPEQRIQFPAQLTHLSFLPTTPDRTTSTFPTILAIFSHCPSLVSSLAQTQPHQNSFSIIARWELHQSHQRNLHSSIDHISSKKKNVSSANARQQFRLKRQPDLIMNSLVLSFAPVWYNMILSFCQSDGSIEFRKRTSMEVITADYSHDKVSSFPQAGFFFSTLEPSLHIALSANHCMAVAMQSDGSVKLKFMEYTHGSLNLPNSAEEDLKHGAAIAALALQHTSACNQYFTSDDIFAVMTQEVSENLKRAFISHNFRALNLDLDCVPEEANGNALILLQRSPPLVKVLSAQNLLGSPKGTKRDLSGKMAWVVLNIRYVTQIMSNMMRMHGQIDKTPLRPEIAPSIVGLCRWMLHLMVWIIDELMTLGRSLRTVSSFDRTTLQAKLNETSSPALLVLLSSFPRIMLKIWQQPLAWIQQTAMRFTSNSPSPEIRRTYLPLQSLFEESPVHWRFFEALVSDTNSQVKLGYTTAGVSDQERAKAERELMMGIVPEALVSAAWRLVRLSLFDEAKMWEKIDPPNPPKVLVDPTKIMFFDTRWLGLDDSQNSTAYLRKNVVDVCQKIILKVEGREKGKDRIKLRRCTRCCEFMEDITMANGAAHNWLLGVAKHCVCSSAWVLAEDNA